MDAAFAMTRGLESRLFDAPEMRELRRLVEFGADRLEGAPQPADSSIELLVTGWECPVIDAAMLDRLPRLRHIVHAGGSVKHFLTPEVWRRGITVTSAAHANAQPVAEFAAAMIVLASKSTFVLARRFETVRSAIDHTVDKSIAGTFGSTVGIVGASATGRATIDLLRAHDVELLVADPTITENEARDVGAELVELDALFERSSVVSLHAPLLPETEGLVSRELLARMRDSSTLINTARGQLVDHDALTAEAASGRLNAILDVTHPEPLPPEHPLWALPNVLLTPHLSGSQGSELHRLGASALSEVRAILAGEPPLHPVRADSLAHSA